MKKEITIRFVILFFTFIVTACSSTPGPVFSVQMEPGFDGYYVQTEENKFLPLEKIVRSRFKENVELKGTKYNFCETYSEPEFLKISKVELPDYRVNAVKGNSGRPEGDEYKLYKITVIDNSKTATKDFRLCAQEIESKLAVHGTTSKIKPKAPLTVGTYYLKGNKWFINIKSRYFELVEP